MSEVHLAFLKIGQRYPCGNCAAVISIPKNIDSTMLPLEMTCPVCEKAYILTEHDKLLKRPPKIDPLLPVVGQWKLERVLSDNLYQGKSQEQAIQEQLASIPQELRLRSFRERVDEIASVALLGYRLSTTLQEDITILARRIQEELESIWGQGHVFRNGYDPKYLPQFLHSPFFSTPAVCYDKQIEPYTHFMASPRFYNRLHGFPLSTEGGFYLQLLCPYANLFFPMESWLLESLGIQPYPKLEVLGSKIVGVNLPDCWKDIPGTVLDDDHSYFQPSIRINLHEKQAACEWLIKHGVSPWPSTETAEDHLYKGAYEILQKREAAFQDLWQVFHQHGRMLVAGENIARNKQFILSLAYGYKGFKLILTGPDKTTWRGVMPDDLLKREFLIYDYEELNSLNGLEEMSLVILDMPSGLPIEFVEKFYHYAGRLVVVVTDPLMDTLEENRLAPTLYGLCNCGFLSTGKSWSEKQWASLRQKLSTGLSDALHKVGITKDNLPTPD